MRHDRYRVYAALMIVVYPLGLPLALSWWLFKHREELRDPGRKDNYRIRPAADLWGSYTRERYYYEVGGEPKRVTLALTLTLTLTLTYEVRGEPARSPPPFLTSPLRGRPVRRVTREPVLNCT